jgi:hypothetical protein
VKLAGKGWRYARAAYHPNGKIKLDAVLVKGANGKNVEENCAKKRWGFQKLLWNVRNRSWQDLGDESDWSVASKSLEVPTRTASFH